MQLDRRQYERELEGAVVRVSELPHDEAERTPPFPVALAVGMASTARLTAMRGSKADPE